MPRFVLLLAAAFVALGPAAAPAAPPPPGVDAAVRRAIDYLKKSLQGDSQSGQAVLAAMALVKAGESPDDPGVKSVLAAIQSRCAGTEYHPTGDHYYTAGVEMMLLEAVDAERYHGEMEKIFAYILKGQLDGGAWYYPNQSGSGDTSITQYAVLGLWIGSRAGLVVPRETWDKMATWHLRTQLRDGNFAYHPGEATGTGGAVPAPGCTVGGGVSLLLARMHLFRGGKLAAEKAPPGPTAREPETGKRFGVLEPVNLNTTDGPAPDSTPGSAAPKQDDRNYRPAATGPAVQEALSHAHSAAAAGFRLPPDTSWKMYYLYAIERMTAIGDYRSLGEHDWYAEGAQWAVATQQPDGSWQDGGGAVSGTAFAVLFLTKATAKMLGRTTGLPALGGGLLAGGRGLPDDLGRVNVKGGDVASRPAAGSLDELLSRLEDAQAAEVPGVQDAVLEAIRFGDREKLIGQRDRLRKLVGDPRAEVRRTAFWALGRGGDLTDVPLLIKGLSDADPAVAVEAHNALCVLSRRPLAFGISGDPLVGLAENAPDEIRRKALAAWRAKAIPAWTEWYRKVAPYDERDGLGIFR